MADFRIPACFYPVYASAIANRPSIIVSAIFFVTIALWIQSSNRFSKFPWRPPGD
jgi:hypothetical protein